MAIIIVCVCVGTCWRGCTVEVLRLIQSFVKETNYTVWQKLCSDLSVISRLVSYTEGGKDLFKEYAHPLFTGVTLGLSEGQLDCSEREVQVLLSFLIEVHYLFVLCLTYRFV